ncbi:hypothetical protein LAZ67_14003262 [Cordylochernes scorpioides]|uniref:Pro-Pol polyprotein n=1 Tax=Cordylochernes scorpioides TaxID=51811 RepID=A0ABY6L7E4_9ARAC|nr:hypothetical protein LAZ67_14003262 [Cordylochernes scorpioides]
MEEMDALKKRRKAIRGTFTRIINEINGEFEKSQIDRNDIYSKFNRLESYYTKLVDLNEKYQALLVVKEGITEESIDREWQECDKYEEEKFDIQQKVSVLRNPDKEETIPIASEDTVINVKLPELALKSYDGSLEGWLPWWAQFSKIHENKNLSDSDRFLYLRQAIVPNSEAYRVVASYPVTGANYVLAVQALQERFGDPNILTELYVRRLLNSVISNVKKENRNLSSLYDELSSHLWSLETLGIDPQLSGIFLYPLVESSLPSDILKIWHRHPFSGYGMELAKREESDKGVGGAQERLRLLLDFLKAEVRSAQRLKFVEKDFKQEEPYKRSYNDGTRTRSNFRPATVSSLFGGRTNIKCFFCERTNHASHQCRSIMKMSPGERNDKIRSAHLCFKCLRKGHIQSQCREQLECKNCGRNHLEVLCEGNSSNRLAKPGRENLKENATEPIASLSSQACTGQVLLMTTVALLRGPNASRRVRILLDSGSQFSYIKQSLVWSVGIERKGEITIAKSLFGGNKIGEEKHGKFMLELENLGNKRDVIHIEALDQRKICDAIPPLPKGDWLEKLKIKGIILPQDNFKGQEIDILIGANYLGMILTGKIVQVEADLTAVETKLGWTLMGNSPITDSNDNVQQTLNLLTTRCDLKDLWDLEVLGIRDPVETCFKETRYQEIKERFITKIQRQSDQRYSVGLPWKVEKESIPSNLDIAIKRLDISTKKMTSQNKLTEYSQIFRDWLTEGLIERVEENPLERRGYYLPHRPVYKMESKTTPIRPVFDASCLGHNGLSLNQCLEKGPNLLERIPEMMIRFRENKFGVTADIRKAFQMVAIEESERNYLRFLWWEKESDRELIAYRHKRLVFGLNCSPFVLNAVIEYHLQSIRGPLVQWAKILAQSFYMDNCITSLETKQEVQEFQKAAIEIMDRAKMDLREWEYSLEENPEKGTCTKILGVVWNKMEDSLKCELPDNLSLQPKLTKRLVLSMVQRIFDPLGFCAPVFLPPKLLLQRSWGLKLGWDTPLPESMAQEFRTWLDQIKLIELIKIPRYMWNDLIFPTEVHIFCDASQIGYGAVAYLRSETGRENTLTLIWSKVRLAPMKSITIPRLELMAMVLGARLANAIQAALKRKCETTLWSDSTTALSWIKKEIEWRVFVRNRVREIQATTNLNDWRFVPSQLNPADLLSRGCPPSQFVQSRWWEGPEWLKKPKEFWPNSEFSINPKEIKVEENIMKTNINLNIDYKDWILTRRSDYSLNIRVMSYVLRFLGKLKKQSTETGPLKVSELDLAEKKLIRMIQEKVSIEKSNATKSFKILKNTDGLWCVESKLLHGQVPEEFKTPIILPGDHPLVEQLIWEVHLKNGHVGVQFILSKLREKFWIIRGRKTIKKIISKCIACKRLKEKSLQRPMAALPENRIGLGKPFQITGVDLLGPLHLKEGGKVWVAAFTCAVYRAIHLELVKSLETGVFMMALHRFICRRGRPEKIYSDNGTNFAKLNRIFKRLDWTRIERETSIKRIQWIFIPPSAPWWGGFWERMVRTIKEMLIKMLGHRKLKYVQLQTALCEIESIINNRPLTYVSEDDNDLKPLTPNEFLQNSPESSFPEFENLKPEMLHTRYRELGQLKRELKQRFLKEYLGALIQKSENIDRRQLKVGDVVLIGQENLKRMFWPKGRIVNLIPGKDGIVRVAHVKTSTGTLIRALQRLHPLEISSNVETIQMDNSNTEPQSEAFLGNRPNTESRDSRNRYGRVIRKPARKRAPVRSQVTKIHKEIISNLESESKNYSKATVGVRRIQDVQKVLLSSDKEIIDILAEDDEADLEKEMDDCAYYQEIIIEAIVAYEDAQKQVAREVVVQDSFMDTTEKIRLPTIELPKFSGNLMDWLTFWAQFEKIHLDIRLKDSDKFYYLLQSLSVDTEAYKIVSIYPLTEENYSKAIDALRRRYANPDLLLQVYVRELLKLVIDSASGKKKISFHELYYRIQSYLGSLKSLNLESASPDTWLYPLVESCLSDELLLAWQRISQFVKLDVEHQTRLDQLMDFLEREILIQQNIQLAKGGFQSAEISDQERRKGFYKKKNDIPTVTGLQQMELGGCIFCEKKHSSQNCFAAKKMSLEEKRKVIREKKVCFKCLKGRHLARYCRTKVRCYNCGSSHFLIMCTRGDRNNKEAAQLGIEPELTNQNSERVKQRVSHRENSESFDATVKPNEDLKRHNDCYNQVCQRNVALQTLMLNVIAPKGRKLVRAFLDSGSQHTYILKTTAEELGLKPVTKETVHHALFGGIQTTAVTHNLYDVQLKADDENFVCKVTVRDQSKICQALPRIPRTSLISKELEQRKIKVTDLGDDNPPIELLIGADLYGKLMTGKTLQLDCGLTAMLTHFGWTLLGSLKEWSDEENSMLVMSMKNEIEGVEKEDSETAVDSYVGVKEAESKDYKAKDSEPKGDGVKDSEAKPKGDGAKDYETAIKGYESVNNSEEKIKANKVEDSEVADQVRYFETIEAKDRELVHSKVLDKNEQIEINSRNIAKTSSDLQRNKRPLKPYKVYRAKSKRSKIINLCFHELLALVLLLLAVTALLIAMIKDEIDGRSWSLHLFTDASQTAYSAVVFHRVENEELQVSFMSAKTRVTPMKREILKKNKKTGVKPIQWRFNPPFAAWWGGWWERLIRSMKNLLKRTPGKDGIVRVGKLKTGGGIVLRPIQRLCPMELDFPEEISNRFQDSVGC